MNFHFISVQTLKKLELRCMKMCTTCFLQKDIVVQGLFLPISHLCLTLFKDNWYLLYIYLFPECRMLAHFQKSKTSQMIFTNLSYPPYFLCMLAHALQYLFVSYKRNAKEQRDYSIENRYNLQIRVCANRYSFSYPIE